MEMFFTRSYVRPCSRISKCFLNVRMIHFGALWVHDVSFSSEVPKYSHFRKKQLQCEETMTPFIIYFLYTFNDIATLRGELTSLLEEALQGMKDDLTLPDEIEYASLPDINIPENTLAQLAKEVGEDRGRQLETIDNLIESLESIRNTISHDKATGQVEEAHEEASKTQGTLPGAHKASPIEKAADEPTTPVGRDKEGAQSPSLASDG